MSNLVTWTAVADSTALAALPVPADIQEGTQVNNVGVGAYFKYTISTAALVPDSVVAVAGVTGARWIVVASAASAITSLTGVVTGTGPGATATSFTAGSVSAAALGSGAVTAAKLDQGTTITGTAFSVTGLGTQNGGIEIDGYLLIPAGSTASSIKLRPNGADTGCNSLFWVSAPSVIDAPGVLYMGNVAASYKLSFTLTLGTKTGKINPYRSDGMMTSSGGSRFQENGGGQWDATAPLLFTGFTIELNDGSAFDTGSWITYKLRGMAGT